MSQVRNTSPSQNPTDDDSSFENVIILVIRTAHDTLRRKLSQIDVAVKAGNFSHSKQLFELQLRSTRCKIYLQHMLSLKADHDGYMRIATGAHCLLEAHVANKSTNSTIEQVRRQWKLNSKIVRNLATQFESSLGILKINLKELVAFTRICPRDEYDILISYCQQRFHCRCRIDSDGVQQWTQNVLLMQSNGYRQEMKIKIYQSLRFGKRRVKLGSVVLNRSHLFRQFEDIHLLAKVNECGTMKLQIRLKWIPPFNSTELWRLQEHLFELRSSEIHPFSTFQSQVTSLGRSVCNPIPNRSISMRADSITTSRQLDDKNNAIHGLSKCRFTSFHESKLARLGDRSFDNDDDDDDDPKLHMPIITVTTRGDCAPLTMTTASNLNLSYTPQLTEHSSDTSFFKSSATNSFIALHDNHRQHQQQFHVSSSLYVPAMDGVLSGPCFQDRRIRNSAPKSNNPNPPPLSSSSSSPTTTTTSKSHSMNRTMSLCVLCDEKPDGISKSTPDISNRCRSSKKIIFFEKTNDPQSIPALPEDAKFADSPNILNETAVIDDCFNFLDSDYGSSDTGFKAELNRKLTCLRRCNNDEFLKLTTWPQDFQSQPMSYYDGSIRSSQVPITSAQTRLCFHSLVIQFDKR